MVILKEVVETQCRLTPGAGDKVALFTMETFLHANSCLRLETKFKRGSKFWAFPFQVSRLPPAVPPSFPKSGTTKLVVNQRLNFDYVVPEMEITVPVFQQYRI